ncbi:MAG: hypothetical protein IRY86_12615 [Thermorudis peleae]|nr:hypothetical protein [Thermorudis peleae]
MEITQAVGIGTSAMMQHGRFLLAGHGVSSPSSRGSGSSAGSALWAIPVEQRQQRLEGNHDDRSTRA